MSSLEKPILTWFKKNKRDLPWRDTTPWGVMVSEYMLQQTPVNRVLPKWNEWMERWPTPKDLARATPAQVITAWGRLGYPRRALRLYAAAQMIAEDFNNQVPEDQETLQLLPGIGEYTAAAIAAFAFEQRSLVMDVNIRRLLVRAIDGEEHPKPAPTAREKARRLAIAHQRIHPVNYVQSVVNAIGVKMVIRKQILLESLKIGMAPIANAEELLFKHCVRMNH